MTTWCITELVEALHKKKKKKIILGQCSNKAFKYTKSSLTSAQRHTVTWKRQTCRILLYDGLKLFEIWNNLGTQRQNANKDDCWLRRLRRCFSGWFEVLVLCTFSPSASQRGKTRVPSHAEHPELYNRPGTKSIAHQSGTIVECKLQFLTLFRWNSANALPCPLCVQGWYLLHSKDGSCCWPFQQNQLRKITFNMPWLSCFFPSFYTTKLKT